MKNNHEIKVIVEEEKLKILEEYLTDIPQDYNELSYYEKRSALDKLFKITNDVIQDRGKAFEEAAELINEYQQVTVLLIDRVEALINKSFNIQKSIMESYMNSSSRIHIKRDV